MLFISLRTDFWLATLFATGFLLCLIVQAWTAASATMTTSLQQQDIRHWSLSSSLSFPTFLPLEQEQLHQQDSRELQRTNESDGDSSGGPTDRGRAVLTFLYLTVLALCFLTPILYYCRLYCEDRAVRRRLEELDFQGLQAALSQSAEQQQLSSLGGEGEGLGGPLYPNSEESRAARRKYMEERRARILQLFAPVRTILTSDNFPDNTSSPKEAPARTTTTTKNESHDVEAGLPEPGKGKTNEKDGPMDALDDDDDNLLIEIPAPGLQQHYFNPSSSSSSSSFSAPQPMAAVGGDTPATMRLASGICSICLCAFTVGSDIVWSSNAACEHVFHEDCIEKWLMKQREGPLCPCCRRDFIVDPFDVTDEEDPPNNNNNNNDNGDIILVEEPRSNHNEPPSSSAHSPSPSVPPEQLERRATENSAPDEA